MKKDTKPFFSIIIPTYNRAGLIGTAIESVINQKFKSWELIIVDDGSTDNTKGVVRSYKNENISYYYQENAEKSIARNNGFGHSDGQYICFLDSDDWYLDNHLEVLHDAIEKSGFLKAFFYAGMYSSMNGQLQIRPLPAYVLENQVEHVLFNTIYPSSVCIHRDILKEIPFDPNVFLAEDAASWARIATKYPIRQVNDYTVVLRIHDQAQTHQFAKKFVLADVEYKLNSFRRILFEKEIYKYLGRKTVRRYISRYYYWYFYECVDRGDIPYMIYFYFKFLRSQPSNLLKLKSYKALTDFFAACGHKIIPQKSRVVAGTETGGK